MHLHIETAGRKMGEFQAPASAEHVRQCPHSAQQRLTVGMLENVHTLHSSQLLPLLREKMALRLISFFENFIHYGKNKS